MIRAATDGVRARFHATKDWLAAERRWAIAALAVLAIAIVSDDSGVDLTPIILSAGLVTIGIALLRTDSSVNTVAEQESVAPAAPRVRRSRSKLWLLTFAGTFVGVGITLAAGAMGLASPDVGQIVALPMTMIGIGLIVGSWWGRSRVLILVGFLLLPPTALASLPDMPAGGTLGETYVVIQNPVDIDENSYNVLLGSGTLDLTHLDLNGKNVSLPIELGVGEIDVLLPQSFAVDVTARLRSGKVYVLGESEAGRDISVTRTRQPELADKGTLTLLIEGSFGSIAVEENWAPEPRKAKRPCRQRATCDNEKAQRRDESRKGSERQRSRRGERNQDRRGKR